ncbi:ferritin-like protein [Streptomyces sp. NPDC085481]|uniref:ferritin-like protein n=1 Tax=Streptomyces sp. NPDC085481 TaxID=3365727 RepID=UPI0037CECC58
MTTLPGYRSNRIVELMQERGERRDAHWLEEALQQAAMLELATLPPYLCAMWSVKDQNAQVPKAIKRIVFDEMSHLGLVGNLLATIGGAPRLAGQDVVPVYPGPLPGGVRPGLVVSLSGMSKETAELFSRIEEPDEPLAEARTHTSIGAFYSAILDAFRARPDLITGGRQLVKDMAHHGEGNSIVAITSLADVEQAIAVIKEQGEGTTASPANPHPGPSPELAHYYVFREIFRGRRLIKVSENPDRWDFTGDEIPMPEAFPMATVPPGGWVTSGAAIPDPDTKVLLDQANRAYSTMLRALEKVWQTDDATVADDLMTAAVIEMSRIKIAALKLRTRQLSDGSGRTYGPEFLYTDA